MFEGFTRHRIATDGAEIHTLVGGEGPPLLLLHGFPQCHALWNRVAPRLAERFTVVLTDLRGYGRSSKPPGDSAHETYCKRTNARDQVAVMAALGFDRFRLAGHDRGARVAHRLVLDHPGRVERVAFLDVVPTLEVFARIDQRMATAYYHWFFLIQPNHLAERLIGSDPDFYLGQVLGSIGSSADIFEPEAMEAYRTAFRDPATVHAMCEDYRAAAGIDLEHDREDRAAGRKVECPALFLCGRNSAVGRLYDDPLGIWRGYAPAIEGHVMPAGHFIPEEAPEETARALLDFFSG